ncbi:hypothetical protein CALCODRAFT_508072 [Calocera cornea HHB12733]|uniref:Uncharacterized protein n=1 Tax=Calocera cornea HHB12733 TaxID=1353952 RepID=A0A165GXQ0_9BASI|nr:hypothetical protein CALCODRAFT_508072 [Calocera cornea HHB12733]
MASSLPPATLSVFNNILSASSSPGAWTAITRSDHGKDKAKATIKSVLASDVSKWASLRNVSPILQLLGLPYCQYMELRYLKSIFGDDYEEDVSDAFRGVVDLGPPASPSSAGASLRAGENVRGGNTGLDNEIEELDHLSPPRKKPRTDSTSATNNPPSSLTNASTSTTKNPSSSVAADSASRTNIPPSSVAAASTSTMNYPPSSVAVASTTNNNTLPSGSISASSRLRIHSPPTKTVVDLTTPSKSPPLLPHLDALQTAISAAISAGWGHSKTHLSPDGSLKPIPEYLRTAEEKCIIRDGQPFERFTYRICAGVTLTAMEIVAVYNVLPTVSMVENIVAHPDVDPVPGGMHYGWYALEEAAGLPMKYRTICGGPYKKLSSAEIEWGCDNCRDKHATCPFTQDMIEELASLQGKDISFANAAAYYSSRYNRFIWTEVDSNMVRIVSERWIQRQQAISSRLNRFDGPTASMVPSKRPLESAVVPTFGGSFAAAASIAFDDNAAKPSGASGDNSVIPIGATAPPSLAQNILPMLTPSPSVDVSQLRAAADEAGIVATRDIKRDSGKVNFIIDMQEHITKFMKELAALKKDRPTVNYSTMDREVKRLQRTLAEFLTAYITS